MRNTWETFATPVRSWEAVRPQASQERQIQAEGIDEPLNRRPALVSQRMDEGCPCAYAGGHPVHRGDIVR